MTEELAKQKVRAVYPEAYVEKVWTDEVEYQVRSKIPQQLIIGESNDSEEAAWQNAAESLPAAPETEIEIWPGYQRAYKKCQKCGQKATYDFVPYSLSSAVLVCPCSHDFRSEYKTISRDEFYGVAPVEAQEKERCEHGVWLADYCYKCAEPKPTPSTPALNVTPTFGRPTVEEILQEWAEGRTYGKDSHFIKEFSRHALTYIESLKDQLKPQPDSSSIPDEQAIEPALKLLADVLHLWVDGYIGKASNSAAPASISNGIFDEIERFLATRNISVDYCGWSVSETQDSSSISTDTAEAAK